MALLSKEDIEAFTAGSPRWSVRSGELVGAFTFDDFNGSMAFVNLVAEEAEKANHHPDIEISWNRVTLTLSTHSEGGLTAKDVSLARAIDRL